MAVVPAEVLLSKRVQEMVLSDEEPPPLYVCRDDGTSGNTPSPLTSISVMDLSLLSSSTPSNRSTEELERLKSALSSWGCFQVVNHGIPSTLLDSLRQVAREFFELPTEEKKKVSKGVEEFEGYGADPVPEDGQSLDWSDRLFLEVYPEDRKKSKFWPETPSSFRTALEEYTVNMRTVTKLISKAMARALELEEDSFLIQFGDGAQFEARFNYYSPCQRPDRVLGLKPHADGSGYTIILQDKVEGLQVDHDGKWFTVPAIPHALLVLMGDQMQIMSNGIFKSPVHRVLTNSTKQRISIAMFYSPEADKEIGAEDGLVDEERPRLYKKVKNYPDIHWGYYQRGKRAIHVAQV